MLVGIIQDVKLNGSAGILCLQAPCGPVLFLEVLRKEIPLTQDQVALVDDADYEWLNQWQWYACWNRHTRSFYVQRKGRPCQVVARGAMNSVLVQFLDTGVRLCCSRYALRKAIP